MAHGRAELIEVIREVRGRWRRRLAARGAAIVLAGTILALLLSAHGLETLRFSAPAVIAFRVIIAGAEGAVNIGYEETTSIAELVALVCDVTGRHPKIVFDRSRPDGHPCKTADSTRLRALTGNFVPTISLRAGIEEMITWYNVSFPGARVP